SPNVVEIVAFGGNRDPSVGFWIDNFSAVPAFQVPRRSVFVGDFNILEKLSPDFAKAMMGHVLREYFGASRPPGIAPSQMYADKPNTDTGGRGSDEESSSEVSVASLQARGAMSRRAGQRSATRRPQPRFPAGCAALTRPTLH